MTLNSQGIIQEVRQEFEVLVAYVTGEAAQQARADEIERGLLRRLLGLGAQLLLLFFVHRAQTYPRTAQVNGQGARLLYQGQRTRGYFSLFGKLAVPRPYFYQAGVGGASPLDGELSLGTDCYSEPLREMMEELAVCMSYDKATHFVARYFGHALSSRTVQQLVGQDASAVLAYYDQRPAPPVSEEAPILVLQADGKGVPLVRPGGQERKVRLGRGEKRNQKKEALVTAVYTVAPYVRTADEFLQALFATAPVAEAALPERPAPQHKQLWATLDGKEAALRRLQPSVQARQARHIGAQIALCDGCEALQQRLQQAFADFTLILDIIHVSEYVWKAATALWGENDEQRLPWVKAHLRSLLQGQAAQVVQALRDQATQPALSAQAQRQLTQSAAYLERNLPYMAYDHYLAQGWPIASGVIEGACRHMVKDRFELSGMRWTQEGAEQLLRLRAVYENDDWTTYHAFRHRHRHAQLYQTPFPAQPLPELRLLDSDSLPAAA
jgi:hypothetical protein